MRCLMALFVVPLLAGCMLVSGERTTIDLQDGVGNISTVFVGAEGQEVRLAPVTAGPAEVQVIAILGVESGDLQIELLQPDGGVVFAVAARPDVQVTRSGAVRTNEQGEVRYRITARSARNGNFQLLFQP
ncbi:MAG: hypothetical protein HC822_16285 [Oscillochloris sp.]|nr:hypothetical protein [Oscillochloris sp.]